jgi:tetratricopeptide (TPR) repeat protein
LAWTLAELGEFVEARRHGEEALSLAQAADHPYSLAHAHLAMGGTLLRQGLFAEAMGVLERGIELCRNVPFLYPPIAADLAVAYAFSGRTSTAMRLATEAVTRAEGGGRLGRLSLIVTHFGEVCHLAGQIETAATRAHWALELALERGELGNQVYALHLLGLLASEQEPPDVGNAERCFGEALNLAERLSMRPLVARCHLGLGRLYRRFGEAAEAEHHLATSSGLFESMRMVFWLGRLALDRVAPVSS